MCERDFAVQKLFRLRVLFGYAKQSIFFSHSKHLQFHSIAPLLEKKNALPTKVRRQQYALAWDDTAIQHHSSMRFRNQAVRGIVLRQPWQYL